MSNKEHVWRLEDDNGKPMGKNPETTIKAFFNGQLVGEVDPLESTQYSTYNRRTRSPIYELGRTEPVSYALQFTGGPWHERHDDVQAQARRIEMTIRDINDAIYEEIMLYEGTFGERPSYISLSKAAYESFFIQMREMSRRSMNEDTFMGIDVVMNLLQERNVMVLGSPRIEMQRSLYNEQS